AAIVVRSGKVRLQRDCRVIAWQRVLIPFESLQDIAPIAQCTCISPIDVEGPVVTRERLLVAPERLQDVTEIGMRVGRSRTHRDRAAKEFGCFLVAFLLTVDDAEQMQRIEMIGTCFENLPVQALGFFQPAGLMQGYSLCQSLVERGECPRNYRRFAHGPTPLTAPGAPLPKFVIPRGTL